VTLAFPATDGDVATVASDLSLTAKVAAPVRGGTPTAYFSAPQYTGVAEWSVTAGGAALDGLFAANTAYTATVILTPVSGYTLAGLGAGSFTHAAASAITNTVGETVTVTIDFSATTSVEAIVVSDLDLTGKVVKPVRGGTPTAYFSAPQYTGNVAWSVTSGGAALAGLFAANIGYTATVTLSAASGYTLEGAGAFAHGGANSLSGNAGVAVIVFEATTSVVAAPVSDLNLTAKVAAPVRGGTPSSYFSAPQYTGSVEWKRTDDNTPLIGLFAGGVGYTATVTLTAVSGYTLDGAAGFTHGVAAASYNAGAAVLVFPATTNVAAIAVTDLDLTAKVAAPVRGGTAATYFSSPQYTGSVAWSVYSGGQALGGLFEANTRYRATVTLSAASGYTLAGITGSFTHAGATLITHTAADIVTITFSATTAVAAVKVNDLDLTDKVAAPVRGGTAATYFSSPQYTGHVAWSSGGQALSGLFGALTSYTATVTLSAASGYTLDGLASTAFAHGGAASLSYNAGVVTINFRQTTNVAVIAVSDLNLTGKVAKPVRGGTPSAYFSALQYTGNVAWKRTDDNTALTGLFAGGVGYTATVTLSAASGYTLDSLAADAFAHTGASSVVYNPGNGTVTIVFEPTSNVAAIVVNDLDLTGKIAKPVRGGTAAAYFSAPQYTGNVAWSADGQALRGLFEANTAYTATVTLSAASGYTFDGLPANAFTHGGKDSITNPANTGTVTIVFPSTGSAVAAAVSDLNLTGKVARPVRGGTPAAYFSAPQYTGAVEWSETLGGALLTGLFAADTRYTATVVLSAASGYTLAGLGSNVFTHTGASSIVNTTGDVVTVTISFQATTAVEAVKVSDLNLTYMVPAPVRGGTPAAYVSESQYTGWVVWSAGGQTLSGLFAADTVYTATVALSAASGYTLDGLAAGSFTHTGATSVVYNPGNAAVTIVFKATEKIVAAAVSDSDLTAKVAAPARGGTPSTYFSAPQYTGTVAWTAGGTPLTGLFGAGTVYTATVTLSAASGYTLDGLAASSFAHSGATSVVYNPGAKTVVIVFKETGNVAAATVSDLNLTAKLAAPVRGGTPSSYFSAPQYTGSVAWKRTDTNTALDGVFAAGTGYTATVTLSAASGYTLTGLAAGAFTHTGASSVVYGGGVVTIVFTSTGNAAAAAVNDLDLSYRVPAPVTDGTPAAYFSAPQYTGNVSWKRTDNNAPLSGLFGANTGYTATVTLSAASGYTFDGVAANAFAHSNRTSITNAAGAGVVVIVFNATDPVTVTAITSVNLTGYIPAPITGATPIYSFNAGTYSGTMAWTTSGGLPATIFEADTAYRAAVTLYPATGYYFPASVPATHAGGSGSVSDFTGEPRQGTVVFPETGVLVFFSGPFSGTAGDANDSVIDLIRAAKTAGHDSLYLSLSPRTETVTLGTGDLGAGGLALATSNSPANLSIDGGRRTVALSTGSPLITVGSGITLTLRNITLKGYGDPDSFIKVESGGRLIRETGAVIIMEGSPESTSWVVSTLAGSGAAGYADGTGTAAQFDSPGGMAMDGTGNVYVADRYNERIRKITPGGEVTTLAGSGVSGYADGTGTAAQFSRPFEVAVDDAGNLYVADDGNHRIRKITPGGVVTTLAGSGVSGYVDGTGTAAQFYWPAGVAVDGAGNVYVMDYGNHRIRKITSGGVVTTLAGSGAAGYADGTGTEAQFYFPTGVAVDGAGNLYVTDYGNHRIRKITPGGEVTTLAGSSSGYADGTGTEAQFNSPTGVAVDGAGNLYVGDIANNRIRKLTPQY
jgi:sugar lactone lactonase YvrE